MALKPCVLGGPGGPPDLNARLRIINGQEVVLDKGVAEQLRKASPAPSKFKAEEGQRPDGQKGIETSRLDKVQTRAALLGQLLNLVYGNSTARLSIVEALMDALNKNTLTLERTITEMALNQDIANALAAGIGGISADERLAIERSQGSSRGIASAVVAVCEPVLASATTVAALSCEALRAQTKAFERQSGDAQPDQSKASVAEDLKGLLTGSTRVNDRKGAGSLASITSVPEVHGAAEAALSAATAIARAWLGAGCPEPAELAQERPSMQLLPRLLELAGCLRAAACLSIARSSAYGPTAACFKGRLDALQAEDGRLMHTAGDIFSTVQAASTLADINEAWRLSPDLGAALLAGDCLQLLQDCINVEACLALIQLRKQPDGAGGAADKKKGKKQAAGPEARKGVIEMCTYLEERAGNAATQLAKRLDKLSVASPTAAPNGTSQPSEDSDETVEQILGGVSVTLDPLGKHLAPLLAILDDVIQSNLPKRKPKVAKGARDFGPREMTIRKPMFKVIENVFERHGGQALETPVFERKDTLSNKYGEDSKLIFDLADQGGEILALRYDHTVPLARYVALNNVAATKRYTIGRSYRRDQPQANKGRFREFYQADYDIVGGKYAPMAADAEVLKVVSSVLSELEVGDFIVKVSHRKLLDAMLTYCGVPKEKFHPICSAIDKLDKEPWEVVRAEMVDQKGLPAEVADSIRPFMEMKGDMRALTDKLKAHDWAQRSPETKEAADAALKDMELLAQLLEAMGADLKLFSFELSLARGLDYYTGLIYEAVLVLPPGSEQESVGSIAAGGRYDELVGQFSSKTVPCVGVSVGVERVFTVLERQALKQAEELGAGIRDSRTQVLIASPGSKDLLLERCRLAAPLWSANIPTECGIEKKPGFMDQIKRADKEGIPIVVVMGEEELQKGVVKVRDHWLRKEGSDREVEVPVSELVERLQQILDEAGSRDALLTKPISEVQLRSSCM